MQHKYINYISETQLVRRQGWTTAKIHQFVGKPDRVINHVTKNGDVKPCRVWNIDRIEFLESCKEFNI